MAMSETLAACCLGPMVRSPSFPAKTDRSSCPGGKSQEPGCSQQGVPHVSWSGPRATECDAGGRWGWDLRKSCRDLDRGWSAKQTALTRLPKANSDSDGLVSHCPAEFNVPIPHKREMKIMGTYSAVHINVKQVAVDLRAFGWLDLH